MCQLEGMPKMIQVRNVPDELHRELMRRAKSRGRTLTDYVEEILEREMARPPREEVFERIRSRTPVDTGKPASELIREERERNERSRRWNRL
jgi:plasmid stability protein